MDDAVERRRRVRKTAILLGLFALAVYIGFIIISIKR
jgi:hypothetical protein